ncbi:DnaA/Hda family protein [Afifella sp. JA880]|uniref:HdaA/DnaA family protein n=1 Tax=Afifella sp. JA880 TaxID=2975280 RepID=UPI0021BAAF49|nr:DnaA/Hda family protein [Afifella sp. JA880]MCT8265903.1 DnaA/Hda family protein [Afifella sp. JA880]
MISQRQIPIPLAHEAAYDSDSYLVTEANRAAYEVIMSWPNWSAPVVLLCGPEGSGKTHLASLWAERAGAVVVAGAKLEEREVGGPGQPVLVEDVAADEVPERALFHLINRAREEGFTILITAREPLARWQLSLKDLISRLRLAIPISIDRPDEPLLRQVLVKLFSDRQLSVERNVIDYMVIRMERSLREAQALVAAIDEEALSEGRRITRPLVAQVLASRENQVIGS